MSNHNEPEELEHLPYCIGNIRHNGVVSTSNRLIRPIELSSNEYKALLYAMAVANYGEKNNQDREITEQTYIYLHKDDLGELLGLDKRIPLMLLLIVFIKIIITSSSFCN